MSLSVIISSYNEDKGVFARTVTITNNIVIKYILAGFLYMNTNSNLNESADNAFIADGHFKRYSIIKRMLDFIFALLGIILAALPMLFISALVKATSKGPAVFRQKRIGKDSMPFDCLKFRTMFTSAPSSCATRDLKKADSFITPVGKVLRKTSLDEIPQLVNVLKGEMSFIGPRPLIPEEKDIHEARQKAGVYMLRPGISGYAQVHGRDFVTAEEKVKMDEHYLHHFGFGTDVRILFDTIMSVLCAKDIHEGEVKKKTEKKTDADTDKTPPVADFGSAETAQ